LYTEGRGVDEGAAAVVVAYLVRPYAAERAQEIEHLRVRRARFLDEPAVVQHGGEELIADPAAGRHLLTDRAARVDHHDRRERGGEDDDHESDDRVEAGSAGSSCTSAGFAVV
jgi:hypothetical protein